MVHLLDTVRRTVAARRLFPSASARARTHVVVACSGGPDSTALAHALHRLAPELGLSLTLASVDHGLRAESKAEVLGVGAFARELGVPFVPLSVRVEGPGLPARARDARYEALLGLARERGALALAVGHTRDDQAETVLARMLRGAGLTGLSGIEPARADGVVRPLIDCTRADVLAYVEEHGLSVVSDPSNLDARFERSRIRHALLPALEAEDPRVREHLARLSDEARALAEYLDREAATALRALGDGRVLPVAAGGALAPPVRIAAIRRWIERETGQAPGRAHVDAIEALFRARGEVLLPNGFEVVREGEGVVLRPRDSGAAQETLRHRTKRRGRGERQSGEAVPGRRSESGGPGTTGPRSAASVPASSSAPRVEKSSE